MWKIHVQWNHRSIRYNEGDLIITEGQQKVCENTPVTIK